MLHQFLEFLKPGNGYGQVISNKTEIVLSNDTVELWFFRMCDIRTCSNCFPKFEKNHSRTRIQVRLNSKDRKDFLGGALKFLKKSYSEIDDICNI